MSLFIKVNKIFKRPDNMWCLFILIQFSHDETYFLGYLNLSLRVKATWARFFKQIRFWHLNLLNHV